MSVLKKGAQVAAQINRVPTGVPTYGHDPHRNDLKVEVKVEDALIRQQQDGFDGMEKVFALVPRQDGGQVRWERQDLSWQKQVTERSGYYMQNEHQRDVHSLRLQDADKDAIADHGIALGMETNVGTLWLQHAGENFDVEK